MLGVYNNFPKTVHKIVVFAASTSEKRLQRALIEVFHRLNNGTLRLEEVATPSVPQCTVIFEFGIGEEGDFSYLDSQERDRLLKMIEKKLFQLMDFLCVIRYYKMQNGKKTPLKFDYYMLRFVFSKKSLEMQIFHEKGLMYVSPKDLPSFLARRINAELSKKALKAIRVS
jgi:hypothetical protein